MRRIFRSLIKAYYKLSVFAFTIMQAQSYLEFNGYSLVSLILVVIFGLGFYLAVIELVDKFCPIE